MSLTRARRTEFLGGTGGASPISATGMGLSGATGIPSDTKPRKTIQLTEFLCGFRQFLYSTGGRRTLLYWREAFLFVSRAL